jgi:hypothetical protein
MDETLLWLACPGCRRVSAHGYAHSTDRPPQDQTSNHRGKAWFRISFVCDTDNCKTPVQFHVLEKVGADERVRAELLAKLRLGHWIGKLQCGHLIHALPDDRFYFDHPKDKLEGYNPHHRRWRSVPGYTAPDPKKGQP